MHGNELRLAKNLQYMFSYLKKLPSDILWLSFRLPPNLPNPAGEPCDILPFKQSLHTVKLPRQRLITGNTMYKAVASPTQPRNVLKFVQRVPSSLQNSGVRSFWNQMMEGQWYPIPFTDLALCNSVLVPDLW